MFWAAVELDLPIEEKFMDAWEVRAISIMGSFDAQAISMTFTTFEKWQNRRPSDVLLEALQARILYILADTAGKFEFSAQSVVNILCPYATFPKTWKIRPPYGMVMAIGERATVLLETRQCYVQATRMLYWASARLSIYFMINPSAELFDALGNEILQQMEEGINLTGQELQSVVWAHAIVHFCPSPGLLDALLQETASHMEKGMLEMQDISLLILSLARLNKNPGDEFMEKLNARGSLGELDIVDISNLMWGLCLLKVRQGEATYQMCAPQKKW